MGEKNAKGKVLVVGNSGVGKTTLIKAVLGEDAEKHKLEWEDSTSNIKVYNGESFDVIDTVGFLPSIINNQKAINEIKKFSKKALKEDDLEKLVNVIWLCVDGTSKRLFDKTLKDLSKAVAYWKNVPVVVVITKSYSVFEREENIDQVKQFLEKNKDIKGRVRDIIPVVAESYVINEDAVAMTDGIEELVDYTNSLLPEGQKVAADILTKSKLNSKRKSAQTVIFMAVGSAIAKGFVHVKMSTSKALTIIELEMITALAKIYGIHKESSVVEELKAMINVGVPSKVAKAALEATSKVPVIGKLGTKVVGPLVASAVVLSIGETAAYHFEKVYLGKKEEEVSAQIKKAFGNELVDKVIATIKNVGGMLNVNSSLKDIGDAFKKVVKKGRK